MAAAATWCWRPPLVPRVLVVVSILVAAATTTATPHGAGGGAGGGGGGCEFPAHWTGRWFQSEVGQLRMNRTSIESKGECVENQGDKFVIYDRSDDCYRCMAIHEKHRSVLQYKETYCDQKASLAELCYSITGDAALYSMFRKQPEERPVACPFKSAPFTFSYNRGSGDCSNPPSRAESCTDDSRLVLKYQACPDVQSTESNVEELVCLATWKEGSTRYLVGRLSQSARRNSVTSDEDQYRCFIYERAPHHGSGGTGSGRVTYHVAQSGDATCNGLQSAHEGSRTMRLTTVDNHHNRCRFPVWITDHHTWLSLDHRKTYKFSLRNATLKILDGGGGAEYSAPAPNRVNQGNYGFQDLGLSLDDQRKPVDTEVRVVCHSILQSLEQRRVQIVAHITAGCDSGYVCMVFYKRDSNVIEIQQSETIYGNTDDACRYFDPVTTPYTTLITPTLHPKRCPHLGRYTVLPTTPPADTVTVPAAAPSPVERRRRRQQPQQQQTGGGAAGPLGPGRDLDQLEGVVAAPPDCLSHDYEALAVGCSGDASDLMEFRSACTHQPLSSYSCHGSWQENDTHYLIASPVARKSTDALRYCFVYTFGTTEVPGAVAGPAAEGAASLSPVTPPPTVMRLSGVAESCHRHITPGVAGVWAFNFTTNGTCAERESASSASSRHNHLGAWTPPLLLVVLVLGAALCLPPLR